MSAGIPTDEEQATGLEKIIMKAMKEGSVRSFVCAQCWSECTFRKTCYRLCWFTKCSKMRLDLKMHLCVLPYLTSAHLDYPVFKRVEFNYMCLNSLGDKNLSMNTASVHPHRCFCNPDKLRNGCRGILVGTCRLSGLIRISCTSILQLKGSPETFPLFSN